jgi:hypothetical protein
MTVSNVIFESHRIRIVTDTLSYRNKQAVAFSRKVGLILNESAALVVRGYRALAVALQEHAEDWKSYSDAARGLEINLRQMPQRFLNESGAEVTLAGHGDSGLAVTRFAVFRVAGDIAVRRLDLAPGVYLAPTLGSHDIPVGMTDDQLLRVALLQQELSLQHNLNMCVGGDVELTTIEPGRPASIRTLGEYPNKAFSARQVARAKLTDIEMAAA